MLVPKRLKLISKSQHVATIREDGTGPEMIQFQGVVYVECTSQQAFAEIVNLLVNDAANLAVAAVQNAISCLQMSRRPADRVDDLRLLQDIHHRITGWHFDSAMKPAPIEGVKPSSGSISLEQAQALLGCSPDRAPAHLGSLKDAIAASRTKQLEAEKASYSNAEVVYDNNAPIFGLDPEKFSDQSTQESVRLYEKYTVGYDKGSPQGDSQMMVLIYNEPDGKNTVLATEPTITSEDAIRLVNDYERRLSSEAKR